MGFFEFFHEHTFLAFCFIVCGANMVVGIFDAIAKMVTGS